MSVESVRRDKAALSSGCKSHPANAPGARPQSTHHWTTAATTAFRQLFSIPALSVVMSWRSIRM